MKNSFKFFSKSAMPGGTNFVSRKYQNWTFYRVQVHDGFNFCVMRVRLLSLLSFQYITRSAIIFCFMIQWNTNHQLPTSSLARRTFVFIFCKTSAFSTPFVPFLGMENRFLYQINNGRLSYWPFAKRFSQNCGSFSANTHWYRVSSDISVLRLMIIKSDTMRSLTLDLLQTRVFCL